MMKRYLVPMGGLALASTAAAPPPPVPPEPVDTERCGLDEWSHHYLSIDPRPARQGAELRLQPMMQRGPAMPTVPIDCTTDWSVSDPALGRVSDDRLTLHIAADATPGATLTVSYGAGGRRVANSVLVVARDAVVLTGRRAQRSVEGCEAPEPVRELEFSAEGRFAVTYRPFETYKDYWGSYRFDPATGALSLKVEGGNDVPDAPDLEGTARIEGGKLVLEGIYLGQPGYMAPAASGPPTSPSCRYIFG